MATHLHIDLRSYLDPELISFFKLSDRNAALKALVDTLSEKGKLLDKEAYYSAILERERVVSTGIGLNVAIPHAKLAGYTDFFIAIGVQQGEGLEWHALDGQPVRLIFMIGGPDDRQMDYLKILSSLTTAIKDSTRRKQLLQARRPGDILSLF